MMLQTYEDNLKYNESDPVIHLWDLVWYSTPDHWKSHSVCHMMRSADDRRHSVFI